MNSMGEVTEHAHCADVGQLPQRGFKILYVRENDRICAVSFDATSIPALANLPVGYLDFGLESVDLG